MNRSIGLACLFLVGGLLTPQRVLSQPSEMIAFSRLTDGNWQIWVVLPDGSGLKQLTQSPIDKRAPAWSPDGTKLAYRTTKGELFVVDLANGRETQWLTGYENIDDPRWPIGKSCLLFTQYKPGSRCHANIWIAGPDGESPRPLTTSSCSEYQPSLSPDGRWLLHVWADETGNASSLHQIWKFDLEQQVSYRLTQAEAYHLHPAWSPDGRAIAYASNATGDYEIWRMLPDGSHPVQLTHFKGLDLSPTWSQDARRIAFVSTRSGHSQLWLMEADGMHQQLLVADDAEAVDPAWGKADLP